MRYSVAELQQEFAVGFELPHAENEVHHAPGRAVPSFNYGHFHKVMP